MKEKELKKEKEEETKKQIEEIRARANEKGQKKEDKTKVKKEDPDQPDRICCTGNLSGRGYWRGNQAWDYAA